MFSKVIDFLNNALYSYVLIIALVIVGIYFTVRTKFSQIGMLSEQLRVITEKPQDKKGVSSFHALMVSTASLTVLTMTSSIMTVQSGPRLGNHLHLGWRTSTVSLQPRLTVLTILLSQCLATSTMTTPIS